MADNVYKTLRREKQKEISLTCSASVRISETEQSILIRKADALDMPIEDLLRVYLLQTSVFSSKKNKLRLSPSSDDIGALS